jgi:hypothetical protein
LDWFDFFGISFFFRGRVCLYVKKTVMIFKEYILQTQVTKYYKTMVGGYDTYGAPLVQQSGLSSLLASAGWSP